MNPRDDSATLEEGLSRIAPEIVAGAGATSGAISGATTGVTTGAGGGAITVAHLARLSGGASQQTWSFDLHTDGGELALILRRAPPGAQVRAAGGLSLATEARIIALAGAAGVQVPRVHLVLQERHGLGQGFVMERVPGETLGRKIVSDGRYALARQVLAYQCGKALACIHSIATESLPPLRMAPAPVELDDLIARHRACGIARPVFELAFQWLRRNVPPMPISPVLVHGDFRNGNLIVGESGLRAVLDWELAHLGDPMEDLGWICVNSWRFGHTDLPVGGFGTRADLISGYEAQGGRVDAARMHYWEILGTLKWGVICESMAHAWLTGAERDVEKVAIGRRASEAEVDLLALLAPIGVA